MITRALQKTLLLFAIILGVTIISFSFALWHHEDGLERVEFSLTNQHGDITTSKQLAGKHLLVFFGFTTCPDICPTQLSKLTQVMNSLEDSRDASLDGSPNTKAITPIFISVDPERDTPEKIKQYLDNFHPSFIGLTGSRTALKRTTRAFNTLLQDAPKPGVTDYMVIHSSLIYIMDPFGRIVDHIPFNKNVSEIIEQIQHSI